jgi:hypothetical protein
MGDLGGDDDEIRYCFFLSETTLLIGRLHVVSGIKPLRTHSTSLSDEFHVLSLALALLKHTVNSRDIVSFTVELKDPSYERYERGRAPCSSPFTLWLLSASNCAG